MKYIVTACSHEHLLTLLDTELDGFIIGEEMLSLRLPYTYSLDTLLEVIPIILANNKEVYIDLHTMITNDRLPLVKKVLSAIADFPITGVIFADPAIYNIASEVAPNLPLTLSTETTTTNWYNVTFWYEKGVKHVALAKELTKAAITSISEKNAQNDVLLEVQGFGPLAMFHSRRNLLNNYFNHLEKTQFGAETGLSYLHDKGRSNYYQIFEDQSGTHIMSPKDVCLIDELDFITSLPNVQIVKLDALGHTEETINTIYQTFIEARNVLLTNPEAYQTMKQKWAQNIPSLYKEDFRGIDKGFLNKPTIY